MKLHFITSISKDYWYSVAKHCISTWDLPGEVTVYIDQSSGDLDWLSEIPYHKELVYVPAMDAVLSGDRTKVRKFWGKSCAQISCVKEIGEEERVIWIDADVEQIAPIDEGMFNFRFVEPFAILNSGDGLDCWETGLVIFNNDYEKLRVAMSKYHNAWNDQEILSTLWKPYDAQVLGYVAQKKGFHNLCDRVCKNENALENSRYKSFFKHWINKTNKQALIDSSQ
jgi:hypothetical protein